MSGWEILGIMVCMTIDASPLSAFLKWFDECPDAIREHIAECAIMYGPKQFPRDEKQSAAPAVRAVLQQTHEGAPLESIGQLLFIINVIEVAYAGAHDADVLLHKRTIAEAGRDLMRERGAEESALRMSDALVEKSRIEEQVWQQWRDLRKEVLSPHGIRSWVTALMRIKSQSFSDLVDSARGAYQKLIAGWNK